MRICNDYWGVNYKELDTQKIKDYILSHPDGVEVEDIIAHSGAEKLRVYPALFELEQEGSGPVRTGAGGMAHGDGTGGAGECEAGEI